MSTDVFKQTPTCGGNGDVDEDSQMGRLECFETLSSGTDSNATDERNKIPSYPLSFNSVDGVVSRSPSGHSDGAVQPIHGDGDDTGNTKRSPSASLKRAFPSPDKGPEVKTKRRNDLSSSPGGKQSSSSSTPRPSVDYPGMSEHADSSCYDFDPFQVPNFAESFKSPTAFPTPTCFSPECTTSSLQNSNSYESPEAPDFDDLPFFGSAHARVLMSAERYVMCVCVLPLATRMLVADAGEDGVFSALYTDIGGKGLWRPVDALKFITGVA
ncbi:hypothetical protein AAHC03_01533 [Spirometra sp. Aus1]